VLVKVLSSLPHITDQMIDVPRKSGTRRAGQDMRTKFVPQPLLIYYYNLLMGG